MLTSIFRYAPQLVSGVGPRFATLLPYTRPGLTLLVRSSPQQLLPIPSNMVDIRKVVQQRIVTAPGASSVSASVIQPEQPMHLQHLQRPAGAVARATVIGIAPTRNFGSYE